MPMKPKTGIEQLRSLKSRKPKLKALDKYVIFSITALIIFTIIAIIVQIVTEQAISDTLVTCFFAAFGGELLSLAMIKRLKLKKGDRDENETYQ